MQTESQDITQIPFSKKLKIEKSDKPGYILMLEEKPDLLNHLDTLHAGVLFTLAESTSGEYLLENFGGLKMDIIPVIRKAEIKYSKPGKGSIYSTADIVEPGIHEVASALEEKGRIIIKVKVDIFTEGNQRLLTAFFEWFVALNIKS